MANPFFPGKPVLPESFVGRTSEIIVGALVAVGLSPITQGFFGKFPGILGILLASVNIFGGFLVTQRMLKMYKKNKKK